MMNDDYIGDMKISNYYAVMSAFYAIDYANNYADYYFNSAVNNGIVFG